MEAADQLSGSVWETEQDHQPPSLNSLRSDSGMNSLEYWDYTVELTQLEGMGHMGQSAETGAAAENEITKQMLTRNKELEEIIKFQRETLQDQAMRIEHLCRQSSMLREMTDSRLKLCEQLEKDVTSLEEENAKLREVATSDKARIQMLKLELEQCVQAIRDTELRHQDEDKLAGARNDEVRTYMEKERKAVEERELLTELAMTRMTDKMKLLEEENKKTKFTMMEMELQIERLREDRIEIEELDMSVREEAVHTTVGVLVPPLAPPLAPSYSCQCQLTAGEPPSLHQQEESRDQLITRLDTQYRELIDKYESLLDTVNVHQSRTCDGQTPATPSALSLQEELGMLECDVINELKHSGQDDEAEMESDINICVDTEESLHLENCSQSSGYYEGEEIPEVERVCQFSQTELSSVPGTASTMPQTDHHTIFSQLFALIRKEI